MDQRTGPRDGFVDNPEDDESDDFQDDRGDLIDDAPPPPDTPVIVINRLRSFRKKILAGVGGRIAAGMRNRFAVLRLAHPPQLSTIKAYLSGA